MSVQESKLPFRLMPGRKLFVVNDATGTVHILACTSLIHAPSTLCGASFIGHDATESEVSKKTLCKRCVNREETYPSGTLHYANGRTAHLGGIKWLPSLRDLDRD